jgi:hypothetical protein
MWMVLVEWTVREWQQCRSVRLDVRELDVDAGDVPCNAHPSTSWWLWSVHELWQLHAGFGMRVVSVEWPVRERKQGRPLRLDVYPLGLHV